MGLDSQTLQIVTLLIGIGSVIVSGMTACMIWAMSQQQREVAIKAAAKAEEVKLTLAQASEIGVEKMDCLAKEVTLVELKENSLKDGNKIDTIAVVADMTQLTVVAQLKLNVFTARRISEMTNEPVDAAALALAEKLLAEYEAKLT